MRSKCRCSCVLQFTFRRAVSCVLHRPPSQVIHCTVLCFKHCSASTPGVRINSLAAYIPSLGWATIQLESSPAKGSFPWRRNLRGSTTPGNANSSHQRTRETRVSPGRTWCEAGPRQTGQDPELQACKSKRGVPSSVQLFAQAKHLKQIR